MFRRLSLRCLGAILVLVFGSGFAGAQYASGDGFYATAKGGLSVLRGSALDGTGLNFTVENDSGWAGMLGFGYRYPSGLRGELELGYRQGDVDSIAGVNASGRSELLSVMANALFDIDIDAPVTPFVGLGLGAARIDAEGFSPVGASRVDDSDTAFAFQIMGGLAYRLSERVSVTLGYRYFLMPDVDYAADSGTRFDTSYRSHDLLVGLRFSFGSPKASKTVSRAAPKRAAASAPMAPAPRSAPKRAAPMAPAPKVVPSPAPPAPPAPKKVAPSAPTNYLVFFDWDSARLTAEARSILRAAGTNAGTNAGTAAPIRIRATGHADRSGPDAYNMRLSLRRANAVRTELVRLGIPATRIDILGRGERDPLVSTADGVREPRNRRVEIVLQ